VLWLCINAAIALRTGNAQQFTAAFTGGLPTDVAAAVDGAVNPGLLLLGVGDGGSAGLQQVLLLLLSAAVSPAGGVDSQHTLCNACGCFPVLLCVYLYVSKTIAPRVFFGCVCM
jgi:hypothetical protein